MAPLPGRIGAMTPPFIPSLTLAGAFYAEVVGPLLDETFPQLRYASALLGPGSEVLGFDTERSTDHDWGPRLQVFVPDAGSRSLCAEIDAVLSGRLPAAFRGYPTAFAVTREPGGPPRHRVEVTGLGSWLERQLGFDPRLGVTLADWLATPAQRLAEFTAGPVFHDVPGELGRARADLAWYPRDVWLYVLACQWQRIAQEEAFPGRCAEVGDELGSAVVTARLARDLMRLCLLMRRRYPPYSKWLGTAFARLPEAPAIAPSLTAAVATAGWPSREQHLCRACTAAAAMHNELGVTEPLDPSTRRFFDRPYLVLGADRFREALLAAITDPAIRELPAIGAVDEFVDSTDALAMTGFLRTTIAAATS
jgi:hypothetical protein